MSNNITIEQAVDDATLLLKQKRYQREAKLNQIARLFLAQGIILELRQKYRLTYKSIGAGVGVSEKTIRFNWLSANDVPESENLIALAKFYQEIVTGDS
jgi:hypothetical protein